MYTTIIDSQTLGQHIVDSDWLVLDCRFNLADAKYGEQVYAEGHIPGAKYLHLDDDLSSAITPDSGRHPLPDTEKFAAKLVSLGLNVQTQVVVYDDCGGAIAVRAWWLLRWAGHQAVAVLDGGFPTWQQQHRQVEQEVRTTHAVGNFKPNLPSGFTVDTQQLQESSEWLIVDARSPERFRGEAEPIDPVAGRVPGSINRPLTDNLHNGLFKPAEQLRDEWAQILAGTDPKKVVHMCGSGVTACHNQLALEIAGVSGTCLYPGSWSEWIRDADRPIATG
ncbi:MAG: Thiosulfate sulfurtransferase, rhodanese (EC [uncultured Thiotrichaceae bacterium]|uniref:Thiosulfate sulfurtransferase, rhodanese (EC) n=1 Tax=uncultured Thiotrichaceae bacterium TaxID=298394 RepID=A0A6S6TH44_9GAMM|nr:MAG: Thiosulfate sulfurtransferase, rhodanese (EC [uncultured Thiotrichaceae bacterium]